MKELKQESIERNSYMKRMADKLECEEILCFLNWNWKRFKDSADFL